jgi:hypothetical protein
MYQQIILPASTSITTTVGTCNNSPHQDLPQQQEETLDTSPQGIIRTIDEINRKAIEILDSLPPVEHAQANSLMTTVDTSANDNALISNTLSQMVTSVNTTNCISPPFLKVAANTTIQTSPILTQMQNCLKMLSNSGFTDLLCQDASDTSVDTETEKTESDDCSDSLTPEDEKTAEELQNVCQQILSPNAPSSVSIASMFARKRHNSTSSSESPELMRVRIAESLLLLGELNKSTNCKNDYIL